VLFRATAVTLPLVGLVVLLATVWSPVAGRASVRGRVVCQDRPLSGGLIVFSPDPERGTRGPVAHALIQADGSYELSHGAADGLGPGWYRVTVAGPLPPAEGPRPSDHFRYPESSKLTAEVRTGENVLDYQVTE
jgi:hypothetical protein